MIKYYKNHFKELKKKIKKNSFDIAISGMESDVEKAVLVISKEISKKNSNLDYLSCALSDLEYTISDAISAANEIFFEANEENKLFDSCTSYDDEGYYFN